MSSTLAGINARHPWSHNDHFHPWITTRLPPGHRSALDVGCGRGELLAQLAPHFEEVVGTDVDATMRAAAAARCAGLPNARVTADRLADLDGPFDLVTMVAVLHHLDLGESLHAVRRLLAPGGRFLAVGLAPPASAVDHVWDVASMLTNPLIGVVKHPWPSRDGVTAPTVPVREPTTTFDELRRAVHEVMAGARLRHRLGFRHTVEWTKGSPIHTT